MSDNTISLPVIRDKKFSNESIVLDGQHFDHCQFDHCALIYRGGYYGLTDCIYRYPTWRFEDSANRTVELIRRIGSTEPGFRTWLFQMRPENGQTVQ
jgi:hypothetical protein